MHNSNFRSVTPNEYFGNSTLVWIERTQLCAIQGTVTEVEGPFFVEEGWGPRWFGPANQNAPNKDYVRLVSTITGETRRVTYGSFLHQTFYVMNEEKLCTDVETK